MNICFLARPTFDIFSSSLYKQLKKDSGNENIKGFFITSNRKETEYIAEILQQEKNDISIFEVSKYIKEKWENFTIEKLIEYENKYDCAPIWKYIYTDRFLVNREYDYVVHITAGLFSFFEDIFSKNKIDFYYSECIATLQCFIAYIVGKKYNVKYVAQMCARGLLDSSYFYFVNDEYQHNALFDNNYLNLVFTEAELSYADKILKDFETHDIQPPAMKLVKTQPKMDTLFFLAPIRFIKGKMDKYLNDPYSYMYYKSYEKELDPIKFYFNFKKIKKFFNKADMATKYVYFPLHYQPEASTCVCAEKYEKQLFFIDSIAKSLPADTVLYVKEHYARIGHRDPHFYKELQKFPNVVIIDPWESSRKLIENAEAIITLTGTAGLEAMLLRKPVILGGNTVFENAPGIIKVDDIYDNYIECIKSWKRPTRDDILKYLCASLRSYRDGNAYAQNYSHLLAENLEKLSSALLEYLKSEGEKNNEFKILY